MCRQPSSELQAREEYSQIARTKRRRIPASRKRAANQSEKKNDKTTNYNRQIEEEKKKNKNKKIKNENRKPKTNTRDYGERGASIVWGLWVGVLGPKHLKRSPVNRGFPIHGARRWTLTLTAA